MKKTTACFLAVFTPALRTDHARCRNRYHKANPMLSLAGHPVTNSVLVLTVRLITCAMDSVRRRTSPELQRGMSPMVHRRRARRVLEQPSQPCSFGDATTALMCTVVGAAVAVSPRRRTTRQHTRTTTAISNTTPPATPPATAATSKAGDDDTAPTSYAEDKVVVVVASKGAIVVELS
jgi:hypothetical protein